MLLSQSHQSNGSAVTGFSPHFSFSTGFSSDLRSNALGMMDQSDKRSDSEDSLMNSPNAGSSDDNQKKTCADCGTTKTPLWRGGPAGPKSLCNACGIRSRKKRRAILGLSKSSSEERKAKRSNGGSGKLGDSLKQRLLALGREVLMQRSTVERQRKKLGEEEQAAVLLMALSYGSVYA